MLQARGRICSKGTMDGAFTANLGFHGNCHLDPMVAYMIGDLPAAVGACRSRYRFLQSPSSLSIAALSVIVRLRGGCLACRSHSVRRSQTARIYSYKNPC